MRGGADRPGRFNGAAPEKAPAVEKPAPKPKSKKGK